MNSTSFGTKLHMPKRRKTNDILIWINLFNYSKLTICNNALVFRALSQSQHPGSFLSEVLLIQDLKRPVLGLSRDFVLSTRHVCVDRMFWIPAAFKAQTIVVQHPTCSLHYCGLICNILTKAARSSRSLVFWHTITMSHHKSSEVTALLCKPSCNEQRGYRAFMQTISSEVTAPHTYTHTYTCSSREVTALECVCPYVCSLAADWARRGVMSRRGW